MRVTKLDKKIIHQTRYIYLCTYVYKLVGRFSCRKKIDSLTHTHLHTHMHTLYKLFSEENVRRYTYSKNKFENMFSTSV